MKLRIGVVGVADGWSTHRLIDAFASLNCEVHLIEMGQVYVNLERQRACAAKIDLMEMDALVIKKIDVTYSPDIVNRLALLQYLSDANMPVYSQPQSILLAIDRLRCTLALRHNQIPIPPTVITEDSEVAASTIMQYGRAILKPLYSSKARGMAVLDANCSPANEIRRFQEAGNRTLYVQKRVDLPGRDLGLVFVGGSYLGCYARIGSKQSWNTTIRDGGRYQKHEPERALIDLACRAQEPFDLAFTCVDVAETEEGPVVFEVSAFGGFRGLWESQRVDAAEAYASYVLERLNHARQ